MGANIYIVKQSDLIGQIADFPIEVVQMMVERQYAQHRQCDVAVFQRANDDGFCWSITPEGYMFWGRIIKQKQWDVFFDRYPRLQNNCTFVVVDGDIKYIADVQRMQQFSLDRRKFAYKNKVGDIYYIDQDRHGDTRVRFALANSALAKEVLEKGVKFGDTTQNMKTSNKLDTEVKSKDASDAKFLVPPSTSGRLRDAIRMLEDEMTTWYTF